MTSYRLEHEPGRFNLSGAKCRLWHQPYFPPMNAYNLLHMAAALHPTGWANPAIAIIQAADPRREERRVRIPKLPQIR
jgi:hypothetical protein